MHPSLLALTLAAALPAGAAAQKSCPYPVTPCPVPETGAAGGSVVRNATLPGPVLLGVPLYYNHR